MEDGAPRAHDGNEAPPRPPSPNDAKPVDTSLHSSKSDEPLRLDSETWDINSVSSLAAVRMLLQALQTLAEATGDIPPTPPVSRPTTPNTEDDRQLALRRLSSPDDVAGGMSISIGSPEAHPHEPLAVDFIPDTTVQHAAIARRFFSKTPPSFPLQDYLLRLHQYCPHSPAVYLAAASFCHRLCVADLKVPATGRTIHRLSLAAIRVAAKALEDHKWSQDWISKVGGVSKFSLWRLEVALCYLLDFELWVDEGMLARDMFLLQQAARQGAETRGKLGDKFKLKLPMRKRMALAQS